MGAWIPTVWAERPPKRPWTGGDDPAAQAGRTYALRSDIWIHVAGQPAYFFLQANLHEGSHALTLVAQGKSVDAYKPYPLLIRDKETGKRALYFTGYTRTDDPSTIREAAVRFAVPFATDAAAFAASDVALSYMDHDGAAAPFVFFGGMLWPWLDFTANVCSAGERNDIAQLATTTGMSRFAAISGGLTLSFIGFARLIVRAQDVLLTETTPKPDGARAPTVLFTPVTTREMSGFVATGTF